MFRRFPINREGPLPSKVTALPINRETTNDLADLARENPSSREYERERKGIWQRVRRAYKKQVK
jgi:hypothetical protein